MEWEKFQPKDEREKQMDPNVSAGDILSPITAAASGRSVQVGVMGCGDNTLTCIEFQYTPVIYFISKKDSPLHGEFPSAFIAQLYRTLI